MQLVYDVVETVVGTAVIKVIGIGGGGCNAINNMVDNAVAGIEFISANTDAQSLQNSKASKRIQLGNNLTRGLGAGADPEIGRNAAMEDRESLSDAIRGANMLFITTGMGGGTGTGAAPVVAELAKEMGILTVAVVTRPFEYEGKRIQVANNGIEILKNTVDSLIVIPNDKLMSALGEDVSMREAFRAADNVLRNAVAGIAEVITNPGIINLDFADVKNVMSIMGMAMMGSGSAHGVDRARIATEQAIASPLLDDVTLDGAQGVLVNITTAPGCLKMSEYKEVMCMIDEYAHDDAALKYGTSEDPSMEEGEIRVTIIATGLQEQKVVHHQQPSNLRVLQTIQSTGTDDLYPDIGSVVRSGRSARSMNLAAADFSNQSVLDDFEIPAVIRRQAD
ncbi:cell division protein FtsZ [Snodgrassella communis]|uniref:Cell division protein FtsZ n=1 Tax=Snodgrassella communis TaxID=2946699 RepID=A0A836Z3K5_9NEIS|nr:cell division protein FtsZ [Snodgrassella communis]KDN15730.1 Cell division protein FtsZ [Snodgrassella communis]PIT11938.1 cell division protein FtsZ [Snodgrassella communis]PIT28920.1 cell division protein FtsZ [Snodgrassella communis]PIT30019.1 cell division protein FtsZ [Snodgrassella communis]PIT33421.1 cell division protein FtsZ [Snodgrassella communis]